LRAIIAPSNQKDQIERRNYVRIRVLLKYIRMQVSILEGVNQH
jgi:hypothetical protein